MERLPELAGTLVVQAKLQTEQVVRAALIALAFYLDLLEAWPALVKLDLLTFVIMMTMKSPSLMLKSLIVFLSSSRTFP